MGLSAVLDDGLGIVFTYYGLIVFLEDSNSGFLCIYWWGAASLNISAWVLSVLLKCLSKRELCERFFFKEFQEHDMVLSEDGKHGLVDC